MTNVTIHRQPTLLLFHNSIWLSNPNYAKFFTLNTFFFYIFMNIFMTYFFEPRIQNYGSNLKSIFIFFFYQLLENETYFRDIMSLDWKWPFSGKINMLFTDWEVLRV